MRAEAMAYPDPRTACFHARRALELAVKWLFKHDASLRLPYQDNLSALVHEPTFKAAAGAAVFSKARVITQLGNQAVHRTRPIQRSDALMAVRELFHVGYWLARTYGRTAQPAPGLLFDANARAVSEPIVDVHHHLWRAARVPWLSGPMQPRIFGDYAAIRRDYLADEYMADARPHGVVKSVYVQVNVAPGDEVEEVAWVQSVGDAYGFPHAIIGYADLGAPDIADTLDREHTHPNLRGVRQQLHWHENPLYRFAPRPDVMNNSTFRKGMKAVAERGLVFELQVFASQMRDAARLARDFPEVTFVLLHAGMAEDRNPVGWGRWQDGMRLLAGCPNVCVKLSGLGTFTRSCSVEAWQPIIERTLGFFGPARCVFGSNFPIEKLWTSYGEIVSVTKACLNGLSAAEQRAVLHDNAERVYQF